jgi:hypothetical protein
MKNAKQAGIWMDHSLAIVMEIKDDVFSETIIKSENLRKDEEYSSDTHEKMQHTKEQHQQSGYYHKLGDIIRNFDDILLFGPTDAKSELLNLLSSDYLFNKKNIVIRNADKLTRNQMHAVVREYFK